MFSADIFTLIENFIGAITSFFYSSILALYLLIRYPDSSPRLLRNRYLNTDTKQVGPLTLIFASCIIFSIPFIFVMYLFGTDPISIYRDDSNRLTFYMLISSYFVGTIGLDLLARIIVLFGWPSVPPVREYKRRESFRNRRLAATYSLVVPAFCANITFACSISFIFYISNKMRNNADNVVPYIFFGAISLSSILARIAWQSSLKRLFCDKSIKYRSFQREIIVPIALSIIVVAIYYEGKILNQLYPTLKIGSQLATRSDIHFFHEKCSLSKNIFTFNASVLNSASYPAIMDITSSLMVVSKKTGELLTLDNVPTLSDIIISPNGAQAISISSISRKNIEHSSSFECNVNIELGASHTFAYASASFEYQ